MLKKRYTRPVTITMEESRYEWIKMITDKEEMSLSEWIRDAIDKKFHSDGCVRDEIKTLAESDQAEPG